MGDPIIQKCLSETLQIVSIWLHFPVDLWPFGGAFLKMDSEKCKCDFVTLHRWWFYDRWEVKCQVSDGFHQCPQIQRLSFPRQEVRREIYECALSLDSVSRPKKLLIDFLSEGHEFSKGTCLQIEDEDTGDAGHWPLVCSLLAWIEHSTSRIFSLLFLFSVVSS